MPNPLLEQSRAAPRPRLRKRVLFSLIMIAGTFLLIEVGAFLGFSVIRGVTFSWSAIQAERSRIVANAVHSQSILGQVHPYVGFVEEPRAESDVTPMGGSKPVPISDFGYYDHASPLHVRSPKKVIVGILGGSVACLFAVNGTDRLRAELEKTPGFAGKEIVFVNLAVGGYKQPQQLMTLSYLLSLGAQFDVVLNIDGFNEVALYEFENAASNIFPAFPRSWHARIEVANPRRGRLLGKLEYLGDHRAELARRFSASPWRFSVTCNVIWDALDRRTRTQSFALQQEFRSLSTADSRRYVVSGPHMELPTSEALYEHLAAIWKAGSIQLGHLCRGNGIRYHHILQPNQYWGSKKPMSDEERRVAYIEDHPYHRGVRQGYGLLIREGADLAKRGVKFHDFTTLFDDRSEPIYVDSCCHYNKTGYELMAVRIARSLSAESF